MKKLSVSTAATFAIAVIIFVFLSSGAANAQGGPTVRIVLPAEFKLPTPCAVTSVTLLLRREVIETAFKASFARTSGRKN